MRKCQIYDENRANHVIFELLNFVHFRSTFWSGKFVPPSKKIPGYAAAYSIDYQFTSMCIYYTVEMRKGRASQLTGPDRNPPQKETRST